MVDLGAKFDGESFDWEQVKTLGLQNHSLNRRQPDRQATCGKILAHCKDKITSVRNSHGGVRLCCFKIGITSNPPRRFVSYKERAYTSMWVLAVSHSTDLVQMLEAALISEFGKHVGCHNAPNTGGEGSLNKRNPPPPPFYVYVTGGRADQPRSVG